MPARVLVSAFWVEFLIFCLNHGTYVANKFPFVYPLFMVHSLHSWRDSKTKAKGKKHQPFQSAGIPMSMILISRNSSQLKSGKLPTPENSSKQVGTSINEDSR